MDDEKRLKRLVEDLVTSTDKELNPDNLKTLKNKCKQSDENISQVYQSLFLNLRKKNSDIRLLCVEVIDQIFNRSHLFRTLVIENMDEFTILCIGTDALQPLPLPESAARKLCHQSIVTVGKWINKFEEGYSKLKVCHEVLKRKVNFTSCSLINDTVELNRARERDRMDNIWRGRVMQVEKEVEDNQEALDNCILETRNSITLWKEAGSTSDPQDPVAAAVCDQYNILAKRLIPLSKKWTVTLTKAGRSTNHQLLRKCVELKKGLDKVFEEVVALGIDFDKYKASRQDEAEQKPAKEKVNEAMNDPTTMAASIMKAEGIPDSVKAKALTSQHFLRESYASHTASTSSASSSNSSRSRSYKQPGLFDIPPDEIPKLKLTDLLVPTKMVVDEEKSGIWARDSGRDGEEIVLNPGLSRVINFSGEFEPVTRSCNFPIAPGKLCPRRDRVKCPFHGPIEDRDGEGNIIPAPSTSGGTQHATATLPTEEPTVPSADITSRKDDRKKGKKGSRKLVAVASGADTARARLEKKVFDKRAVKRVSRVLDSSDQKRTKSLFSEQFNYTM